MDGFIYINPTFPLIAGHFRSVVELKKKSKKVFQYLKDGCDVRDSLYNCWVSSDLISDLILANSKICCRAY